LMDQMDQLDQKERKGKDDEAATIGRLGVGTH
jgi:hypothetical protein